MSDLELLYLFLEDLDMSFRAKDCESLEYLLASDLSYFMKSLKKILEKGEKE